MATGKNISFIEKLKKELSGRAQVTKLSDPENIIHYNPSGILILDTISGKGIPEGRWIEIFGQESSRKSLLAALIGASYQRRNKSVVWIDMERTTDPTWYKRVGLDVDNLIVIKPESAEDAFYALDKCIDEKVDLVVIDSIASMATQTEMENDPGDQTMAVMARLLSSSLRKLTGKLDDAKTTVIMINQLRSAMAVNKYAVQEVTTGGKAIPFYCTLRFQVSRSNEPGSYTQDEFGNYLSHTIKIKNIKNKVGAPKRSGSFMLIYDGGPDNRTALIQAAQEKKYITLKGAWYSINFNGQEIKACGVKDLVAKIAENKELQEFLFDACNIDPYYRNMFDIDKREINLPNGLAEITEADDEAIADSLSKRKKGV